MRYLLILLVLFAFLGCQSNNKPAASTALPSQIGPALQNVPYPPVPEDIYEKIVSKGDHMDIVFYKYPISVSRDGNKDVVQELTRLNGQTPKAATNCQPDGRMFFNGNGETLVEADLYVQPDCYYVVFYKDGKPAYASGLTPEAIQFYDSLTKQFRQ